MAGLITAAGSVILTRMANSGAGSSASNVFVIPDPSETEQGMIDLVSQLLDDYETNRAGEAGLKDKMSGYADMMMSDSPLSQEEAAMFEEEYDLQLSALQEQFGRAAERTGASRMAELSSRGVLETTTGTDIISQDQEYYADQLSQSISELLTQKEVSIAEAENAKRSMAQQGYELTSNILQSRQFSDLSAIGSLQDYSSAISRLTAQNQFGATIRQQTLDSYKYNKNLADAGKIIGAGVGGLS